MLENNEQNGPKPEESEEIDMDRLLREIDELIEQNRSRKEAKTPEPPLSVPSSGEEPADGRAAEFARTCMTLQEPAPASGPPGKRNHTDESTAETPSRDPAPNQRPIYNVFILPAGTKQITPQDLERLTPLKITDANDIPAWLAELPLGEAPPTKAAVLQMAQEDGSAPKHAPAPKKRKLAAALKDVWFYLVLIAVVVAVFIFAGNESGPKSFAGYSAFTVLSGSMESEIPKGSLVVTKQVDPSQLQIGDDITYLSNPTTTITHRIVGIIENYADTGQRAFTTQGVMNNAPDKQPVPAANVVGKVIYHSLPLGQAASFLQEHWLILLLLAVLLLGLFHALKVAFGKDDTEKSSKKPARSRHGADHNRGEKS